MKTTGKFTNKFQSLQPKDKLQNVINGVTEQQNNLSNPVPPTPQQEHRTVLLGKIRGLLGWAYDKSNTGENICYN